MATTVSAHLILTGYCTVPELDQARLACTNATVTLNASSPDAPFNLTGLLDPAFASFSAFTLSGYPWVYGSIPPEFSTLGSLTLVDLPGLTGILPANLTADTSELVSLHLENLPGLTLADVTITAPKLKVLILKKARTRAIRVAGGNLDLVAVVDANLDLGASNIHVDSCSLSIELGTDVPCSTQPLDVSPRMAGCSPSQRLADLTAVRFTQVTVPPTYCFFSEIRYANHTGSFRVAENACRLDQRAGRAIPAELYAVLTGLSPRHVHVLREEPVGAAVFGLGEVGPQLQAVVLLSGETRTSGVIAHPGTHLAVLVAEPSDPSQIGQVAFSTTLVGNFRGVLPRYRSTGYLHVINTAPGVYGQTWFPVDAAEEEAPVSWKHAPRVAPGYNISATGATGHLPTRLCGPGLDARNNFLTGFVPEACYEHAKEVYLTGNCWWCCNGVYPFSDGAPRIPHPTAQWANEPCCLDLPLTEAACAQPIVHKGPAGPAESDTSPFMAVLLLAAGLYVFVLGYSLRKPGPVNKKGGALINRD